VAETRLTWQPTLFDGASPSPDAAFSALRRHQLDRTAWLDHAPGWLRGADALFADLLATAPWQASRQELYGRVVETPRLIARWSDEPGGAALPPVLEEVRRLLIERYERPFDSVSANLYRDGRDSVAWHGDRIPRTVFNPLVATVSLGHPRRFLMRPRGGVTRLNLTLGPGDLVVMGGTSQRTWQHSIPKTVAAGPRISIAVRHSR
jgi:alkylated DNA repair dioxygenase AlkB